MSFFSKKAIYYLVNQFYYYLLIRYIKTPAMLKHQQFEDSESDETESRVSKYQQLDEYDNKERQGFNKYENKDKGQKYVLFPFVASLLPF